MGMHAQSVGHGTKDESGMRITDQFRDRGTMVYDLKGCGQRISLRMSERSQQGTPLEWELAVLVKQPPSLPILTAVATTRDGALAGLVRAWQNTPGFAPLDWTSIRNALAAVRAI
jgi:hypothetical protein